MNIVGGTHCGCGCGIGPVVYIQARSRIVGAPLWIALLVNMIELSGALSSCFWMHHRLLSMGAMTHWRPSITASTQARVLQLWIQYWPLHTGRIGHTTLSKQSPESLTVFHHAISPQFVSRREGHGPLAAAPV